MFLSVKVLAMSTSVPWHDGHDVPINNINTVRLFHVTFIYINLHYWWRGRQNKDLFLNAKDLFEKEKNWAHGL